MRMIDRRSQPTDTSSASKPQRTQESVDVDIAFVDALFGMESQRIPNECALAGRTQIELDVLVHGFLKILRRPVLHLLDTREKLFAMIPNKIHQAHFQLVIRRAHVNLDVVAQCLLRNVSSAAVATIRNHRRTIPALLVYQI